MRVNDGDAHRINMRQHSYSIGDGLMQRDQNTRTQSSLPSLISQSVAKTNVTNTGFKRKGHMPKFPVPNVNIWFLFYPLFSSLCILRVHQVIAL